ncbi:zinc finger MYM-type protein 5-like [Impatiens glandulifera]|uniref:zinc finger MYM-type protein 5-like n=1 Tax=Impatiens glandulifera TaxID=253017 RepID=UPI001FB155BC|nr:zinc finger MYM-type protein 5-like [Impatiens glandulifera]
MAPKTIRKHELGSSKCNRIKERDKFIQSQSGAMDKFVFNKGNETQCLGDIGVDIDINVGLEENVEQSMETQTHSKEDEGNDDIPNIFDPKNWNNLAPKLRDLLVKKGPLRDVLTGKSPKNGSNNKRFTSEFYIMHLSNGQKHHRDWLVYCKDLDRVFCFCCKVFKTKRQLSHLAHDGIRDWGTFLTV